MVTKIGLRYAYIFSFLFFFIQDFQTKSYEPNLINAYISF